MITVQKKPTYQCLSLLRLLLTVGTIWQTCNPCQDFSYPTQRLCATIEFTAHNIKYCIIQKLGHIHGITRGKFTRVEEYLNPNQKKHQYRTSKQKIQQIYGTNIGIYLRSRRWNMYVFSPKIVCFFTKDIRFFMHEKKNYLNPRF
jgi:hypothetical protein